MATNPYVNKVQYGSSTIIDITDTTAVASDVAQGKYFYLASGQKVAGTSSGGGGSEAGTVTQDQDGFLVLDDDAPSGRITVESLNVTQNGTYTAPTGKAYSPVTVSVSGGGGGLTYETGTWTPTNDTANYEIEFLNTHTTAPCVYLIGDTEGDYLSTSNTNFGLMFADWHTAFGVGFDTDDSGSYRYGRMQYVYRTTTATSFADAGTGISNDTGSSSTTATLYWASSTRIRAATNGSSRFWRAGRTYKWLAIWAPTS